jgi:hypothetical protein
MKVLMEDKRVDPIKDPYIIDIALRRANVDIVRLFLADERIIITNELLDIVDLFDTSLRLNALFTAAHPRIWPRVISNDTFSAVDERGHLRSQLESLEVKSSWMLLLCVKRRFTPRIAARVGDVLREVCSEWTRYWCPRFMTLAELEEEEIAMQKFLIMFPDMLDALKT